MSNPKIPISGVIARAYTIPTDRPEADGTLSWNSTTLITVHVTAGEKQGFGYTYADASVAPLINHTLAKKLLDQDVIDIPLIYEALWISVRNLGRSGLVACAISAIDLALWDLKAKSLDVNLSQLLGQQRNQVEIYGSGGFTSYDNDELARQLSTWVEKDGCRAVKMKIGSNPTEDPARIQAAKRAIGEAALFVDANGAFTARRAIAMIEIIAESDVRWFEEPVSSDDWPGLAMVRENASAAMDIAAGEYSYVLDDVRLMLQAGAVDVQQCDITRCGGITGFLRAAALCDAFHIPLSGHCAPSAHLHAACAAPRLRHLEWFHDQVRIEQMLFDGAPRAQNDLIEPDLSKPGNGLAFKHKDAEIYAV
jgi:L-alanine-DL-glutamate epimerase-like enolase superfamily enzyme